MFMFFHVLAFLATGLFGGLSEPGYSAPGYGHAQMIAPADGGGTMPSDGGGTMPTDGGDQGGGG